jgi:hypothetical protein
MHNSCQPNTIKTMTQIMFSIESIGGYICLDTENYTLDVNPITHNDCQPNTI